MRKSSVTFLLLTATSVWGLALNPLLAEGENAAAEVAGLRSRLEAEILKLEKPIQGLNQRYRQYLEKQRNNYKKAGNLKGVLAVEDELKLFTGETKHELSPHPELNRLQKIYRQQRSELDANKAKMKVTLVRSYREHAEKLASDWTKADRIGAAKLALAEAESLASIEKDPSLLKLIKEPDEQPTSQRKSGDGFGGTKPGEEMENSIGMKLCWIPAGKFEMGDAKVNVELTKGFWMGKYEVTQEEYEEVMESNPAQFRKSGKKAPVERVNWQAAMDFCAKLTERERRKRKLPDGWKYTLPTEAQWEYACRAGIKGDYNVEGAKLGELGWFDYNSGNKTHEVGKKMPNAWGLHDMHGNVMEWCKDWVAFPLSGGKDPGGPESGSARAIRSGSYRHPAAQCQSANRGAYQPDTQSHHVGLRPALVPSGTDQ